MNAKTTTPVIITRLMAQVIEELMHDYLTRTEEEKPDGTLMWGVKHRVYCEAIRDIAGTLRAGGVLLSHEAGFLKERAAEVRDKIPTTA